MFDGYYRCHKPVTRLTGELIEDRNRFKLRVVKAQTKRLKLNFKQEELAMAA